VRGRAFASATPLTEGATVTLDDRESHYLVRVRRAAAGDAVELLDGVSLRHRAVVEHADPKACVVRVGAAVAEPPTPPQIVLMGIVDASAVSDAIAGASEAGATAIVPVRTERAQSSMPGPSRITKLVRAAQRQCGRAVPLRIESIVSVTEALARYDDLPGWFAHPGAVERDDEPSAATGARVLVGPEGGLSEAEVAAAREAGFWPLSLGPYVQRTPTAIVTALALLRPRQSARS